MIHFTFEEKLAIVGACAAVVALLAIIMACKLSPYCFLFKLCPFRAQYDDDDEETAVKVQQNTAELKTRYKLIDYKNLLPAVPSIKVTTLDETPKGSASQQANTKQTKSFCLTSPVKDDFAVSGQPGPTLLLTRPSRRSTSSFSGSSTASSDNVTPPRGRLFARLRKNSGTFSSDGDDTVNPFQPAVLEIGLQYDEVGEKLSIQLFRARRLPSNVYGGANDSFVQIVVGKDTNKYWRRKSEVPVDDLLRRKAISPQRAMSIHAAVGDKATADVGYSKLAEFQTRLIRKDAEPVFKERFEADDVKAKERKSTWIKFILHSIDRFSHQYIVGTKQIGLERASPTGSDMNNEKFNITLDQYAPNLGEITLTLCYLPTSARLVVTITKITNLKPPDGLVMANPYVKGAILRRGKVLEKHVTSPQLRAVNPTFSDEPLVFDVPTCELEKIVLLITVVHDDAFSDNDYLPIIADGGSGSDSGVGSVRRRSVGDHLDVASESESNFPLHKSRSNSCVPTKSYTPLGRLAFGSLSAVDPMSKRHWAEMMSTPRAHVARTHKLRP